MEIRNSDLNDVAIIFELYETATAYMKSKKQVYWPEFSRDLVVTEIHEQRQWKLLIDDQIACIWATALDDELIWGATNDRAVYIHRITTNINFRGQNLVGHLVKWADNYCYENNLEYVRMDTVSVNKGLIKHYEKLGFELIEVKELESTEGLPDHYNQGPVCLFQREVKY